MEIEEIGRCYGTMRGEIMGENRKIYAALLGAGTVGSGVYKLAGSSLLHSQDETNSQIHGQNLPEFTKDVC